MTVLDVRIVTLPPMRVASVRVISEHPERDAWQALRAWAEPRGLLADPERHPVYGFNNPNPAPGSRQYGYEYWLRVEPTTTGSGTVTIQDVPGGRYAVTTHRGYPDPGGWATLWDCVHSIGYRWGGAHELERRRNPTAAPDDVEFDLYLPIADPGGT